MLRFKKADLSLAEQISGLVNSCYRGDLSKKGWTTEADILGGQRTDREKIQEIISKANSQIEVAFNEAGELIACVEMKRESSEVAYFGMLAVSPLGQGHGAERQMLERVEEVARSWGCKILRATVIHVREELIQYYERRGFRRTGKTEPFPYDDPRFGIPKVQGLSFIEIAKNLN